MRSDLARYIIGFLVAVGLIVLVIVLLVRSIFSGPSGPAAPAPQPLSSYADTATTVQFTIDSPVAASQDHHDIIINVGNSQAILTVTRGYDGDIVRSKTYPMSNGAYAVFLHALSINGFTEGNAGAQFKDERGQCALGDRYIYEIIDPEGQSTQRFWHTSCGNGTFNGTPNVIRRLFQKQIPDYFKLVQGVQL